MIVSACSHDQTQRFGKNRNGSQRVRCTLCGKTWTEAGPKALGDMRIPKAKAVMALRMMLEGSSLRTIHRLTGLSRDAISALLLLVGERCRVFLKTRLVDLPAFDVQCDEVWSFIGCKEKKRKFAKQPVGCGDCYTYIAIDPDSKLVLAHHVGVRSDTDTRMFAEKLARSIRGNCHITTDGFSPYTSAIPNALWQKQITYSQLIKIFGKQPQKDETRYSPAPITGIIKKSIWGDADKYRTCTSHIERWNLSLRMGLRRFTRLTNAFSKSFKYHRAAIGLWICFYNFCRVHQTLRTTPAVAAKLADQTWSLDRLLEEMAANPE